MGKYLVVAGHTLSPNKGGGAIGYINESNENRVLGKLIQKYLKLAGHECDYYQVDKDDNYLASQVATANKKSYDLVIQVHFNANKTTMSPMGTETLYKTANGKVWADKVTNKLGTVYKQRGSKKRDDLYWLNKTKASAILIEVCFVDSKADTDTYILNKDLTARLIAESIHGKSIEEPKPPATNANTFYRVVAGSYNNRDNAQAQLNLLESKGIKGCFIDIYKK